MSERKVKQTQNYFLKHRFGVESSFVRDFGLSFTPQELRIKSVSFAKLPTVGVISGTYEEGGEEKTVRTVAIAHPSQVYTLHLEGLGDICAFNPTTDRVADYTFILKTPISGQQNFQVRDILGKAVKFEYIEQSEMIIHMEFVEFSLDP